MLIRSLKTTHGSYGTLPRGKIAEVVDHEARYLIDAGYAIEELSLAKQEAAPIAANDNIPFEIAPPGGQTGADVPQSLSPAGRVQEMLTCPSSEDEGQLNSSPSITDTDSPHGQTSSTPATKIGGKRKRGRPRSKG